MDARRKARQSRRESREERREKKEREVGTLCVRCSVRCLCYVCTQRVYAAFERWEYHVCMLLERAGGAVFACCVHAGGSALYVRCVHTGGVLCLLLSTRCVRALGVLWVCFWDMCGPEMIGHHIRNRHPLHSIPSQRCIERTHPILMHASPAPVLDAAGHFGGRRGGRAPV